MAPTTTARVDDLPADVLAKERELADALEAFLERQEKVVLARLYGPKARKGTRHWKPSSAKAFDPREPRDVRGRWTVVSFPVETLKGVWAGDYDTTRVGDLPDVLPARPDLADVAKRGVREPIHLTRLPEPDEGAEYELQDGHNRAAAAIRARLTHIPAVIHEPVLDAQGGITYPTWDAAMVQGVRRRAKAAAPAALSSTQPASTPAWALDTPPPAPPPPSLTQIAAGTAAVTGVVTVPPITAGVGLLQAAFILDATRWALLLRAVLDPFIEYSVAAAHEDLARQLAEESLFGSLALAFKRGLIEPWIQRGTDTMQRHFKDVQLTIDRGERQGLPLEQIATSIRAAYKRKRDWARLVAGNVMVGSFNAGQQAAAQVNPRVAQKAWVTQRDEKVRPTHRAAEGQVQDVDAPFIVGGGPMMYPGDLTAPIGEWINCFPAETEVAGVVVGSYRRWYEGPMVRLRTASGRVLTGTPNHPALTDRGWIGLGALDVGDHLVNAGGLEGVGLSGGDPDVQRTPALIGEVHHALTMDGLPHRVAGCSMDFHGDGGGGEVDVVRANRMLRLGSDALCTEQVREQSLTDPDVAARLLGAQRPGGPRVSGVPLAPSSLVRSQYQARSLVGVGSRHADVHGGASIADLDAPFEQSTSDNVPGDGQALRDRLLGLTGQVALDEVLDIQLVPFSGHVFNLQTLPGWYTVSGGLVVHNCRCTMVFRIQSKPSAVPFRVNDRRQRDLAAMRNERDSKGWVSTGVKVGHDVSRELRGAHGRWVRTSGGLLDRPAAQRMWRDTLSEVGASGSDPWQVQDVSWGSIPGAPQTPMARLKATVAHDLAARMADVDAGELAAAAAAGDRPGSTMRADSISALVQAWAGTSNDSSVLSLSLQEAAKAEFGIADAARWDVGDELSPTNKMLHRNLKEHGDVYRKFLRAQYDATQADFKAQGITSVQVYRGMTPPADRHGNPLSIPGVIPKGVGKTPTPMTVTTRPMSSWSTDPYIAYGQFGEGGVTFGATVPIERVLSTPRTGFGALRESEIVLLGGPLDTVAIQSDALVGTGSSSPFTAALPTQVKASAGQPYNVDDGDEYADWLRALGWDLPEDLDGFLTAIGGRGNVEHFMTLPAARAMPVALRVLLDAPQDKAFNPALHPRDERGRWARVAHALTQALRTAPMGGTVAPREATVAAVSDVIATGHVAMTKARGLAQLRKVQPNIDPEFAHELVDSHKIYDVRGATVLVEKGTSPTVTKPFLDQVDSLQAKNPLKDPGMLVFLSREAFQALEADEPGASTTTGAFTNAVLRMMAIMPEAIPRDTWAAQLQPRTPQNPSWTMPAAKSVWPPQRYLVTHEWGHATGYRYLDPAEAGNRARVRTMEEQGAVPINGRVPDVIAQGDAFTSAARWAMNSNVPGGQPGGDLGLFLHKYLSGYGLTSPQEGYAELFTQYFLDGARKGNPLVDALRDAEGWKR